MKTHQKVVLLVSMCGAGLVYLAAQEKPPAPAPVSVAATPEAQSQVDIAWKDLEIAQLHLQIAVQQALAGMDKADYYDFQQRKFFKSAPKSVHEPAATKPKQ